MKGGECVLKKAQVRHLTKHEIQGKKKLQEQVVHLLKERGLENVEELPIQATEKVQRTGLIIKG